MKNKQICTDCAFIDHRNELDKCPYCGSDDWKTYKKKPYMFKVKDLKTLIKPLKDEDWVDLTIKEDN